jgi:hypothetical protein
VGRQSNHDATQDRRGIGSPRSLRRRAIAIGVVTTAVLGIAAQASYAGTTVELGIANNEYPALKDPLITGEMQTTYGANTFTFGSAGQPGGYWNLRGTGLDNTTLRGITSGQLRKQLLGPGPYTSPSCDSTIVGGNALCENGPLQIDGFWSADEGNVNQVIPSSGTGSQTGGTCAIAGSITACPGIGSNTAALSTKRATAIGQLAIYSCSSTYATDGADPGSPNNPVGAVSGSGNGVPSSPRCEATPIAGGAPTTIAGVISWLAASTSNRIAIALPSSAPFGAASKQALVQNGGGGTGFTYDDSSGTSAQNAWPSGSGANQCEGTLPVGAVCQVRLEAGISQVRGAVTSGTTPLGLAAKSTLKHITWGAGSTLSGTTGDDPNPWITLASSTYSGYGLIQQWGVGIRRSTIVSAKETVVKNILQHWAGNANITTGMALYGF